MDTLPHELIVEIANYLDFEWICQDYIDDFEDDNISCENEKMLLEYNKQGKYYPLFMLYATCKSFQWLKQYEYVCIENGDFHGDIVTRNIHGAYDGMVYNIPDRILGYSAYNNGKIVYQNRFYTDASYFYRCFNGVRYVLADECESYFEKHCHCHGCTQLLEIQKDVFMKDPFIKELMNKKNGSVFMRNKHKKLYYAFNIDGLMKADDYFK